MLTSVAFSDNRLYLLAVFAAALFVAIYTGVMLGRLLLVVGGAVLVFALPVAMLSGLLGRPAVAELLLLRSLVATTLAALLFAVLGTGGIFHALAGIGMPRGLRSVLTICLGQVRVLASTASDMMLARAARTGIPLPWSRVATGMGTSGAVLLRKSLQQSDELHQSMLARGFDGTLPQLGNQSQWRVRDFRFLALSVVIALTGSYI